MKKPSGSTTIIAIGLGFILLIVVASIRSFTSYRIQTTVAESLSLKALAIAEAGLACIIGELTNDFTFKTHKVKIDASTPDKLVWDSQENYTTKLEADTKHKFSINTNTKGTYSGKIGEGEFKVRCGIIPYKDNPNTKYTNEQNSYYYVESMGRVGNFVKCIKAILKKRHIGHEFLMYSGDILSIVYGSPNVNKVNKFSTGILYGHNGVEIGQILMKRHSKHGINPGTNQELCNLDYLIAGNGGIFIYNDIKSHFRKRGNLPELNTILKKNVDFPTNGTYVSADAEELGSFPRELENLVPSINNDAQEIRARVKDKRDHISFPPRTIPFEMYKKAAQNGGLYISTADLNLDYKVPAGYPSNGGKIKAKLLDFGTQIRNGNVSLPSNFNGVIFCEGALVIKGNPPTNMIIVAKDDIFVAGDFNQAGNPNVKAERYGFPQNYDKNALESDDYTNSSLDLLKDDHDPSKFAHHRCVTVISNKRVVYDYRNPLDCFENEIYPYMKYLIAEKLTDSTTAENQILKINGSGGFSVSLNADEVKNKIASFFQEFPLLDSSTEQQLAEKFKNLRSSSNNFSDNDFDNLCKEVLEKYRELYASNFSNSNFGIYKILKKLWNKCKSDSQDKHDDYLFYPEMTTNGIFIACAKRNQTFYAGPDYAKHYDQIGNYNLPGIGIEYFDESEMLHRVYGSEIRLETTPVGRITGHTYTAPTRRKIYDPSLPYFLNNASPFEYMNFRVISWKEERSTVKDFENF